MEQDKVQLSEETLKKLLDEDKLKLVNEYKEKGYKVEMDVMPANNEWETAGHDSDEILIVLEGEVHLKIDGTTQPFLPGDLYKIPKNKSHGVSIPSDGPCKVIWVHKYDFVLDEKTRHLKPEINP